MPRLTQSLLMVATLFFSPTVRGQDAADEKLKRLIERITRGDEVDAADAADQLVDQVYGPLTRAIGSLEKVPGADKERSIAEQVRLRKALGRLHSSLRVRLFRLDLPEQDRKLFDKFAKENPDLTDNLFADHEKVRKAAIASIPLDRDTGAGVMICARVDDEVDDVADVALDAAAKLKDAVVGRGLLRYLKDATAAVNQGYLKDSPNELLASLALLIHKSLETLAVVKPPDAAPIMLDAYRTFSRLKQWDPAHRASAVRALGDLADERVVPTLLEALDITQEGEFRATQAGATVRLTVGDAALLGLLKIYDLKPESFGFVKDEDWGKFTGFADDKTRQDACRRFRIWHEQNAAKPKEQRAAPASQPAPKDNG